MKETPCCVIFFIFLLILYSVLVSILIFLQNFSRLLKSSICLNFWSHLILKTGEKEKQEIEDARNPGGDSVLGGRNPQPSNVDLLRPEAGAGGEGLLAMQ